MLTADLPDLRAGIYRHYKGHFYLVLGYAHDANADVLAYWNRAPVEPLGERTVVVYVGLELTDAHQGPRLAVRTVEDFFMLVCPCGNPWQCQEADPERDSPVPRFKYMGPAWYGRTS